MKISVVFWDFVVSSVWILWIEKWKTWNKHLKFDPPAAVPPHRLVFSVIDSESWFYNNMETTCKQIELQLFMKDILKNHFTRCSTALVSAGASWLLLSSSSSNTTTAAAAAARTNMDDNHHCFSLSDLQLHPENPFFSSPTLLKLLETERTTEAGSFCSRGFYFHLSAEKHLFFFPEGQR